MNPADFLERLVWELHLRGHQVNRSELADWVQDAWPLIEEDDDPGRWAEAYLEAHQAVGAEPPG